MFIPGPGKVILECDFSMLEMRIIALLAQEEKLLEAINNYDNGLGRKPHWLNASALFGTDTPSDAQYKMAKGFFYGGIAYGGSADTVWRAMVVDFPDLKLHQVRKMQRRGFAAYPAIKRFHKSILAESREKGYVEAVLSGRREHFHDGRIDPNKVLNYPMQSMAGDIMNRAIVGLHKALKGTDTAILFQVHDAIVVETPKAAGESTIAVMRAHMEQEVNLNGHEVGFPVDCSVGPNWGQMEEL
jgi:DNA polymerase-1